MSEIERAKRWLEKQKQFSVLPENPQQLVDILASYFVSREEWVSVEDRMPEFAHDVLKCDEFGYQSVDYIDPDTGEWSRGGLRPDRVKFWRELPKAPAETEGR